MSNQQPKIHPYTFVGIHYQQIMKNNTIDKPKILIKNNKVTQKEILKVVSDECGVTIQNILSECRKHTIVDARYIYFAALKLRCGLTLDDIGYATNRDHTTVIHGLKNFHNRYVRELHYKEMSERVFEKIQIEYDGAPLTCSN